MFFKPSARRARTQNGQWSYTNSRGRGDGTTRGGRFSGTRTGAVSAMRAGWKQGCRALAEVKQAGRNGRGGTGRKAMEDMRERGTAAMGRGRERRVDRSLVSEIIDGG